MSNHLAHQKSPSYLERLDVYFAQRESLALGVPQSSQHLGRISNLLISKETGIPRRALEATHVHKHVMRWVSKIGLSEPVAIDLPTFESAMERGRLYEHKIDVYIDSLRREAKSIPESTEYKGRPYFERISTDSGVPLSALKRPGPARQRLLAGIAELGLKVYLDSGIWWTISYKELLNAGHEWRDEELRGRRSANQQLYNTETALRCLMKHISRTFDDQVGPELHDDFDRVVLEINETITKLNTRRKFSTEIRRWQEYYQRQIKVKDLPSDFRSALEVAIERIGLTTFRVAALAGGHNSVIANWISGLTYPARRSYSFIQRIEKSLGLPPKALISRIAHHWSKRFRSADYPEFITINGSRVPLRSDKHLLTQLRPLLPNDYDQRAIDEREEIASWLITNLIRYQSEYGRSHRLLIKAPYRIKEFPSLLKTEWEELVKFKCDKIPPPGMKRHHTWSSAATTLFKNEIGGILGVLTLPKTSKNPLLCGLGLDPNDLTLAMLICPKLLHSWVQWRGKRRQYIGGTHERYTKYESRIIFAVGSLLNQEVGWIRQRRDLADHLKTIPGFIDNAFIKRARNDWDAVCGEALSYYNNLATNIEDIAEQIRDPFEPILPILESDNPIAALKLLADNVINDMPDQSTAPLQAARSMRNYLIVRILSATALRSRNMRELTYLDDNSGELRYEGDKWVIEISNTRFKNKNSSFFGPKRKKANYRKILPDIDLLYSRIEEYVKVHRPLLLGKEKSDILLVANEKRPMITATKFHETYRTLTMRYLAHNPYLQSGITGIKPHGPHTVRDIIATHVIKVTGSYELAAYAIGDSLRTVQEHYVRFMPKDKVHLVDGVINSSWTS
jgi:hypothetical protein